MYKFLCKDNRYESYQYVETSTFQHIETIDKTPKELKLFANDIFDYDGVTKEFKLIHSNLKSNTMIPGILDLTMTHGKERQKFLYLCKPDDKRIPFFLIPYNKQLGFDKSVKKIYITYSFKHWNYERPYGTMTQNLGSVDVLHHYYEYILYCKSLNVSIQQFTKETKQKLKNRSNVEIIDTITEEYNFETRHIKNYYIFTLDSESSNDYDDALSYCVKEKKLSIYISNVAIIMDFLELWRSFSNRVSTIYLPDKKRTMLPSILIDCLCSLKEKNYKLCYVLDLWFDDQNEIKSHSFTCCKAYIAKNVFYEKMGNFECREDVKAMLSILRLKHLKQVVTKLMLLFNHMIAKDLYPHEHGVYKTLHQQSPDEIQNIDIPRSVYEHICVVKNKASQYCAYRKDIIYQSNIHKEIDAYAQASSPIRRLVDLLNNIAMMNVLTPYGLSDTSTAFYRHWICDENIENINITSRAIRKIQSKCFIYEMYENNREHQHVYKGYVFDKAYKPGDGKYQYMVYIEPLQLTTYITLVEDVENFSCHFFSLYVFMSEENDKKKIKLQLCYENKDRM